MTRMVQVAMAGDVTEAEELQTILRSAGMTVSTPWMAGHSPGLAAARWSCRYSSSPGVAEMIFEWGPFQ